MIFKILLETNLQIVFWSVFNPIKAPVIAWLIIIAFLRIIKNRIGAKLNTCG